MRYIGYLDNSRDRTPALLYAGITCGITQDNNMYPKRLQCFLFHLYAQTQTSHPNYSASPSLFSPTISYSPPPSLPLPLPLPLPNPCSSSPTAAAPPAGCCALALPSPAPVPPAAAPPPPPKLIGLSSLHLQLHTPRPVINAALENCRAHQRALVGIEWE